MPLDKMIEKARKLIRSGRIEYTGDGLYNVIGDHGTYTVARKIDGTVTCSCPGFIEKKRCSHSLAVILSSRGHRERRTS
ncbi:MAG: SWIM zinc finger domain-containing protein [Candidatus Bathyarchaeota archaeon]|nr:SWIM zinc finger domain-containing protein [Candidatus Bathyarchaeota archaeon]